MQAIQETVSEDYYFRTDNPAELERRISLRRAVLGCYRRLERRGGPDHERYAEKVREVEASIKGAESKLAGLRAVSRESAEGRPAVTAPFRGKFVEVRRGGRRPVEYQIVLRRTGEIVADARALEAANQTAEKLEGDEAERDAGRLSRRVARFFRVNLIFN